MKRLFRTLFFVALLLLGGCLGKVRTDDAYRQELIVEGRIEAGGRAEVVLTTNLAAMGEITQEMLEEAVGRR